MKGQIFLSGGGDIPDTQELDKKYFESLKDHSKILYIPIAMHTDVFGYESCSKWFSGLISMHSGDKNIDFTMMLEDDSMPNVNDYDSVYIGGGNTFALLDYIVRKGLNITIADYIKNGGIVYGGSAGAIIFGKDIRTVEEENDNNYSEYHGLNICNDSSIICHYKDSLDQQIYESARKIGTSIIAIPENGGLIILKDKIEVVGDVLIFDKKRKEAFKS